MSQILTARRARKPYTCDNGYPSSDPHPDIEPGQVYARVATTPHDWLFGNTRWMVARYCKACAEHIYGWHTS